MEGVLGESCKLNGLDVWKMAFFRPIIILFYYDKKLDQLSQRHRAMTSVIEYFAKPLNLTQRHLSNACVSPY